MRLLDGLVRWERNVELVLLLAAGGFVVLALRALERAGAELPANDSRIVAQFMVVGLAGHLGLRLAAPRALPQPFACAMVLAAVGLAFATRLVPELAQDQANWITLGVIVMVAAAALGRWHRRLRAWKYTAAFAAIVLLGATGLFGTTINGARLWVTIAGQQVQTTELIKVLVVVFLAGYLADAGPVLSAPRLRFGTRDYPTLPYLLPLLVTLIAAIGALALLRDLGSVALLILLAVAMLYVATGRARFVIGGVGLLAATALFGYLAFDHAEARIDAWLHPYDTLETTGFQTVQAAYAFEAGGVTGEGLGLGSPDVIPAVATDYVFAAIGEELGLMGAAGVVLVYVLLVLSGLKIAVGTQDNFSRLLAACVALLIGIQAAVIIAGNLRLIPTTGITLPFVSYGGSSLVVNFALVGLLLGVSSDARRAP